MEDMEMKSGNVLDVLRDMESESVHCVVTSPPYYKMRSYDGSQEVDWPDGTTCPLGLEDTPELFVDHLTLIFREMRRVLRDDGVFWLNIMDGYAGSGKAGKKGKQVWGGIESKNKERTYGSPTRGIEGVKDKDLMGIPWMLALSLRNDGWYLRSSNIWAKSMSFCSDYVGSCMPESVTGVRWERHKVKNDDGESELCPGCDKCEENEGYVLRQGSWRPTRSHEYVFMFTKSDNYFCDQYNIMESGKYDKGTRAARGGAQREKEQGVNARPQEYAVYSGERNPRSVWVFNPARFDGSHFAVFPEELIEPMIRVSTSHKTCGVCGKPWARIVDKTSNYEKREDAHHPNNVPSKVDSTGWNPPEVSCDGWKPMCDHEDDSGDAVVLDPFMGRGTTLFVARKMKHKSIGVDISGEYLEIARDWIRKRMKEDKVIENERLSEIFD